MPKAETETITRGFIADTFHMPAASRPFDLAQLFAADGDREMSAAWQAHRQLAGFINRSVHDDADVDRLTDELRRIEEQVLGAASDTLRGTAIKVAYLRLHAEATLDDYLEQIADSIDRDLRSFLIRASA